MLTVLKHKTGNPFFILILAREPVPLTYLKGPDLTSSAESLLR
jgi:hypothetical protein